MLCNPCSLLGTKTLDDECELVVGCRLCGLFAFGGRGRFMEHAVVLAQTAYVVGADFRGILGKERESLVHKAFVGVGLTLGGELGVFFALCHDFLDLYGGFRVGGGSYSFGLWGRSFVGSLFFGLSAGNQRGVLHVHKRVLIRLNGAIVIMTPQKYKNLFNYAIKVSEDENKLLKHCYFIIIVIAARKLASRRSRSAGDSLGGFFIRLSNRRASSP